MRVLSLSGTVQSFFNSTDCCNQGGGIVNVGGFVEIINTTVAGNRGGGAFQGSAGAGVANCCGGLTFIINSTIRENEAFGFSNFGIPGAGIVNQGGTLQIQNTIVAGNTVLSFTAGPDCFGDITSVGNNLFGDLSGCDVNLQPTDLTGDPGLGPLVAAEDGPPGEAFYPVLPESVLINRANPAACAEKDQLGNPRVGSCDIGAIEFQGRTQVAIDIRPRSEANKVNPNSTRSINVAVLSDNGFDATNVDSSLVRFGATGTEAAPIHVARRDVNRDGQRDLVLRFQIQNLRIECGASSLTLTGQILDGQSIIGSSPIITTGCKQKHGR